MGNAKRIPAALRLIVRITDLLLQKLATYAPGDHTLVDWRLPGMLISALITTEFRSQIAADAAGSGTQPAYVSAMWTDPALLYHPALRDLAGVMATTALCSKAVNRTLPSALKSKTGACIQSKNSLHRLCRSRQRWASLHTTPLPQLRFRVPAHRGRHKEQFYMRARCSSDLGVGGVGTQETGRDAEERRGGQRAKVELPGSMLLSASGPVEI